MEYYLQNDDGTISPTDMMTWALSMECPTRQVAKDEVGDAEVSTVFLGMDHSFTPGGPPVVWETMIFGGKHDQYQDRCGGTRADALDMHCRALKMLKEDVA